MVFTMVLSYCGVTPAVIWCITNGVATSMVFTMVLPMVFTTVWC
jgi:hypothetical protein